MDVTLQLLKQKFPNFERKMLKEMLSTGQLMEFPQNTEVVRHGQYLKMLPIVIEVCTDRKSNLKLRRKIKKQILNLLEQEIR